MHVYTCTHHIIHCKTKYVTMLFASERMGAGRAYNQMALLITYTIDVYVI